MDCIKFVLPDVSMEASVKNFRQSFFLSSETKINGSCRLHKYEIYSEWLENLKSRAFSETYLAVRSTDEKIIGIVDIRRELNSSNYQNGHIGLSVSPGERRKGYGAELVRKTFLLAKDRGIDTVIITCDKTNAASKKMIQKSGFVFQKEITEDCGNVILVYERG